MRRTSGMRPRHPRPLLPSWMSNIVQRPWFRVSPIFFLGTVVTAAGTTIQKSDAIILVGMIIMAIGVVAMWIAEIGKLKVKALPGPLMFMVGSVLSALSMTRNPSNMLLCIGMILTGIGTIAMWAISMGELRISTAIVVVLFCGGIITEALGLTVAPSDMMVMVGMIATGIGAFAMWAYETNEDPEESKEKSWYDF